MSGESSLPYTARPLTFACPAASCECERAFSSAKKLIALDRSLLGDNLIEALECLRAWWNNGLVKRP
jgi:hAT family C-terminal dimerisation region